MLECETRIPSEQWHLNENGFLKNEHKNWHNTQTLIYIHYCLIFSFFMLLIVVVCFTTYDPQMFYFTLKFRQTICHIDKYIRRCGTVEKKQHTHRENRKKECEQINVAIGESKYTIFSGCRMQNLSPSNQTS